MRDPAKIKSFMDHFRSNLSVHRSVRSAYTHTEIEWASLYGDRFYKNYETFRSAKSQYFARIRIISSGQVGQRKDKA